MATPLILFNHAPVLLGNDVSPSSPGGDARLLLENGFYLLQETGDYILLE